MDKSMDVSTGVSAQKYIYFGVKRLFDILFSLIGCICLIPVMIIVKIFYLISKDYKSIFYTQERIGKNGKVFKLYKFRSMVWNADEVLKELLKDEKYKKEWDEYKKFDNDPRITKVGNILRKTSLDELPQMINILKGEMSFIGNRPYLPREKDDMGKYYDEIVSTKPGLTGYWQVNGRSTTTFKERLKLEAYYSKNISLKMEMSIFFKTFSVVLLHKGAK